MAVVVDAADFYYDDCVSRWMEQMNEVDVVDDSTVGAVGEVLSAVGR